MDRRTYFRVPSVPLNSALPSEVSPKKELSSLEHAQEERQLARHALVGGGALMASGVMVIGHEIAKGSLDNPLQIAASSLIATALLVGGRMSYKEGSARLALAHEYAFKTGVERATAIKVASEVETTPIKPPTKERHLHVVR